MPGGKAAGDRARWSAIPISRPRSRSWRTPNRPRSKKGAARSAALKAAHDRFYKGDIAQDIVGYLQGQRRRDDEADLAAYAPQWETPLHTTYRGYDVYSNASTSRGGFEVLMQLNLIEGFDLAER